MNIILSITGQIEEHCSIRSLMGKIEAYHVIISMTYSTLQIVEGGVVELKCNLLENLCGPMAV